jgi:putative transposase
MARSPRNLQPGYCYHVTLRCNNREFHLAHPECEISY